MQLFYIKIFGPSVAKKVADEINKVRADPEGPPKKIQII